MENGTSKNNKFATNQVENKIIHTTLAQRILQLYLPVGFTGLFIAFLMWYSMSSGSEIANKYLPLVDATMEIKLEVTTAHLWFEEIISGDRNENIESVWQHLDLADWYAHAMLEGGVKDDYKIKALTDGVLRQEVQHVRFNLSRFRHLAEHRYQLKAKSGVGTALDQEFDQVFQQFIFDSNKVEKSLHGRIQRELTEFIKTGFSRSQRTRL